MNFARETFQFPIPPRSTRSIRQSVDGQYRDRGKSRYQGLVSRWSSSFITTSFEAEVTVKERGLCVSRDSSWKDLELLTAALRAACRSYLPDKDGS